MKLLLVVVGLCVQLYGAEGNGAAVSEGVNKFSIALYKELSAESGNLVVSPFSVEAVVAMLLLGLRGDTAKHVTQALFLPETRSEMAQGFKSIFTSLQASQNVILEIANKMYIQDGFNVKDQFLKDTEDYFNSIAEEVDIASKAEEVRIAVNNWAANKTHDKIKDLLPPGTLTRDTVMVLLNAIYFKGLWKKPFAKELTSNRPFFGVSNLRKFMLMETELPYTEVYDLDAQVLKLPYKGDKFSMLIFLPRDRRGLAKLESKLDKLNISKIQSTFYEPKIIVELPRFKILSTIDLKQPLTKLGMEELFVSGDFSGITDESIAVSKALQKAFIEVNEEGTEAAAVTALTVVTLSVGGGPERFVADHPFMYMIVDEDKDTILFMGRVVDPTE